MGAEERALAREAYVLWRDLAVARANPYGDHTGCLLAGRMAVDATRWEDGLIVLAAIRQRMDEKSSPRWIPEWARELGGTRRREQTAERYQREGRDTNGRHIPGRDDIEDPEVRRVLIAFGRAKARDMRVTTESWTCVECRQFTDGRCESCQRPVHPRGCRSRHPCSPILRSPVDPSDPTRRDNGWDAPSQTNTRIQE